MKNVLKDLFYQRMDDVRLNFAEQKQISIPAWLICFNQNCKSDPLCNVSVGFSYQPFFSKKVLNLFARPTNKSITFHFIRSKSCQEYFTTIQMPKWKAPFHLGTNCWKFFFNQNPIIQNKRNGWNHILNGTLSLLNFIWVLALCQ